MNYYFLVKLRRDIVKKIFNFIATFPHAPALTCKLWYMKRKKTILKVN